MFACCVQVQVSSLPPPPPSLPLPPLSPPAATCGLSTTFNPESEQCEIECDDESGRRLSEARMPAECVQVQVQVCPDSAGGEQHEPLVVNDIVAQYLEAHPELDDKMIAHDTMVASEIAQLFGLPALA